MNDDTIAPRTGTKSKLFYITLINFLTLVVGTVGTLILVLSVGLSSLYAPPWERSLDLAFAGLYPITLIIYIVLSYKQKTYRAAALGVGLAFALPIVIFLFVYLLEQIMPAWFN